MWKRPTVATLLTTAALALLLSFKTPQSAPSFANAANGGNAGGVQQAAAGAGATTAGGAGATTGIRKTYSGQLTGNAVDIGYGVVQVQVTIQNGVVADVQAVQLPGGGHSGQVSSYAAPQLRSEALQAQSAQINTISGATYTSEGYMQSLQSALDQIPA